MAEKNDYRFIKIILVSAVILAVLCGGIIFIREILNLIYPQKYINIIKENCDEYNVEIELVLAIIRAESSFNPQAVSSAGAIGLMQITPETFNWINYKYNNKDLPQDALFIPETNIKSGIRLIRLYLDEFSDISVVLSAYNAGRNRTQKWLEDPLISPDGTTLNLIPYPETRDYVKKVIKYRKIYRILRQFKTYE